MVAKRSGVTRAPYIGIPIINFLIKILGLSYCTFFLTKQINFQMKKKSIKCINDINKFFFMV